MGLIDLGAAPRGLVVAGKAAMTLGLVATGRAALTDRRFTMAVRVLVVARGVAISRRAMLAGTTRSMGVGVTTRIWVAGVLIGVELWWFETGIRKFCARP